jgi:hypothetical protein
MIDLNGTGYKIRVLRAIAVASNAGAMLDQGGGRKESRKKGPTFIDQVILASSARFSLSLSVSYLVPFSPLIS